MLAGNEKCEHVGRILVCKFRHVSEMLTIIEDYSQHSGLAVQYLCVVPLNMSMTPLVGGMEMLLHLAVATWNVVITAGPTVRSGL